MRVRNAMSSTRYHVAIAVAIVVAVVTAYGGSYFVFTSAQRVPANYGVMSLWNVAKAGKYGTSGMYDMIGDGPLLRVIDRKWQFNLWYPLIWIEARTRGVSAYVPEEIIAEDLDASGGYSGPDSPVDPIAWPYTPTNDQWSQD